MQLILFDMSTNGNQVGPTLSKSNVFVANGLFTVVLDFGPVFQGQPYWLETQVRPLIEGESFKLLQPRQPISPAPYALYATKAGSVDAVSVAWTNIIGRPPGLEDGDDNTTYSAGTGLTLSSGQFHVNFDTNGLLNTASRGDHRHAAEHIVSGTLPNARLEGVYGGVLSFSNPANTLAGNGAGITALNANNISSGVLSAGRIDPAVARLANVWQLAGNTGTVSGLHFLGTTDNQPLELKVNASRALRLEPGSFGPNVVGGGASNAVTNGAGAASISGGSNNIVEANFAHIGGGRNNRVLPDAEYAAIPGGFGARARSFGQLTHAGGSFSAGAGDAQASVFVLRGMTSGANTNELFLDGNAKRMLVPTNGVWTFDVLVAASTGNNTQAGGFLAQGVIKNNGSITSLVGTNNQIMARGLFGGPPPAWNVQITVPSVVNPGDTDPALIIRVNGGPGPAPVRWVATVRTAELIFP